VRDRGVGSKGTLIPLARLAPIKRTAAQGRHAAWPAVAVYWPATQGEQDAVLPTGAEAPKKPAAHTLQAVAPAALLVPTGQLAGALEPAGQKAPAGQGVQVAADVAPVAADHVPAAQSVGAAAPAGQKAPAGHVVCARSHTLPNMPVQLMSFNLPEGKEMQCSPAP